jgi:crotonobetainyl-CoA:carnitine CoA-transferase CaiB-like acyl-CoA transferase
LLPLETIRILDLSRLAPGPFCSMMLGDLGADVLLIERPAEAKSTPQPGIDEHRVAAHNVLRRNKRSLVLNLREPEGREVFYKLADRTDVVLEGFRPGVVKRLGVDYETLRVRNPRLVYCSISGYGQWGPYAQMVGHDINYISIGGALGMIGWPGQPPAIPMNVIADFAAGGMHAAYAILAALLSRDRTGRGQYVDIAMSDSVVYLLASIAGDVLAGGDSPKPGSTTQNGSAPYYNVYQCSDGRWLSVGSVEPRFFANLCRVLDCEHYINYQDDPSKLEEIAQHFRKRFLMMTRDEWFEVLKQTDICAAPVYTMEEALRDPHNLARRMVVEVQHSKLGAIRQPGIATKLSETPGEIRMPGRVPGQDTDEVLKSIGYDAAKIASLRESGIVA